LPEMTANNIVLHRAPWVVTGTVPGTIGTEGSVFSDGAVLAVDGWIQGVGRYKDLAAEYSQVDKIDHDCSILTPALINGHTHLELSVLAINDTVDNDRLSMQDMTVWIRNLLASKQKFSESHHDYVSRIMDCGRQALDDMFAEGVAFAGDIGNHVQSSRISKDHALRVCFLLELLGFTRDTAEKSIDRLHDLATDTSLDIGFTAHAPYSATPALMQEIKRYSQRKGNVFSIHAAESDEEIEFLRSGTGSFKEFLIDRGAWDDSFKPPGTGAIQYLDQLGVLDQQTVCVHAVHINAQEINILAEKKAKVCLCPGSNRTLGVGKAPVDRLLKAGILPAIGTDSLASNVSLNMWREMQILRDDHPAIEPAKVFSMATAGGAAAWGRDDELGALAIGKRARFLSISCQDAGNSALAVFEYLTGSGESVQVDWVEQEAP